MLLLYSLLCSHSTLTAETFPSSVALSVCQSEQRGDRGGVAGAVAVAAAAVAVAAAAAAALGGDHSAGILRAGSTRAPGWVRVQWVLTEVLKLLRPVRPSLRSLLLLSSQSTSKVLTQEKDKGSNR